MWMLMIAVLGCETKDPFEDTGSAEVYGQNGYGSGSYMGDGSTGACLIAGVICVEANEPNNEAWCNNLPADYSAIYTSSSCSLNGVTGACFDMEAGGDYTNAGATVYYYGIE